MEHTQAEREKVEKFIEENGDIFEELAKRLRDCIEQDDITKLSWYALYTGKVIEAALNTAQTVKRMEKEIPNA